MRALFFLDLLTLLPLLLVGGRNALWWIVITLVIGLFGAFFSFSHLGTVIAAARGGKINLQLPYLSMIALSSLLLFLPGLLSDLIGVLGWLVSIKLLLANKLKRTETVYTQHENNDQQQPPGRVIDVNYTEVKDKQS